MADSTRSIWREFFSSPHHAVLALGTLGAGFVYGNLLGLIVGAAAYVIGWVYGPDLPLFRRWLDRRNETARRQTEQIALNEFIAKRTGLINQLNQPRRERYFSLANVCQDIAKAGEEAPADDPFSGSGDPRQRKLEELMWTFLRLLTIEQSLEQFLEAEAHEDLPGLIERAEAETAKLRAEIAPPASGAPLSPEAIEAKRRLLDSRSELLETLQKRRQRVDQAQNNLALVRAEQDRLDQQIKLIRADSIAAKNANALSDRINATVEHLEQTHRWLAEMDEFNDALGDLPVGQAGAGFGAPTGSPSAGGASRSRTAQSGRG
ncbi:MAG TPA: hypothetical protein VGH90_01925 [Chthoniobacteraceae bacterium]